MSLMQLIRKMLYGFALILPAAPVMAQDNTDTTYVFRFVPTDDMFYEALGDNRTELERLEDAVEKYYGFAWTATAIRAATARPT